VIAEQDQALGGRPGDQVNGRERRCFGGEGEGNGALFRKS
jgi:hypothetical protein